MTISLNDFRYFTIFSVLYYLFVIIARRATQIKVLYFDRNGLYVWSERLEQGRLLSD
ncbi:IS66 family insertion sequence element accessory protein TnpB [Undibacterium sp. MH2W]|uniref:IS66 family insertion sequence element accessory protein TnpB n=1 Tax=Undibacterium sp. MH2W TaxID=3413044 RepID=UPI003BF1F93A